MKKLNIVFILISLLLLSLTKVGASEGAIVCSIAEFVQTYENPAQIELPQGRIVFIDESASVWASLAPRLNSIFLKLNDLEDVSVKFYVEMPNLAYGDIPELAFFECSRLTSFSAPVFQGNMADGAFGGCTQMTSFSAPKMCGELGNSSFTRCESLTTFDAPNITGWIPMMAFSYCSSLTFLGLPNVNGFIGNGAFVGCFNLKEVYLPSTIDGMGAAVFEDCPALRYITLGLVGERDPGNVDPDAFSGVDWDLCELNYVGTPDYSAVEPMTTEEFVERFKDVDASCLPQGRIVLTDKDNSTWNADAFVPGVASDFRDILLKLNELEGAEIEIIMPAFTEDIPARAFYYCQALKRFSAPIAKGSIYDYAFEECYSLEEVSLYTMTGTVHSGAFKNCSSLELVDMNRVCGIISSSAFTNCTSLQNVSFPLLRLEIQDSAFENCSSLTSIHMPYFEGALGNNVFQGCSKLTNIVLGPVGRMKPIYGNVFGEGFIADKCYIVFLGTPHCSIYPDLMMWTIECGDDFQQHHFADIVILDELPKGDF